MTITMNDFLCLFHLPLVGNFLIATSLTKNLHVLWLSSTLGLPRSCVMEDFRFNMGSHFCPAWLQKTYQTLVKHSMYEVTVRVYMLCLLICIILEDNSYFYIDSRYISLMFELEHINWALRM